MVTSFNVKGVQMGYQYFLPIVLKGLLIGFIGAAVFGPISALLIQRTLQYGWRVGLAAGTGVAIADGLYGFLGGLGLNVLTSFLLGHQTTLRLVGGLVIIFIGVKALVSKQAIEQNDSDINDQGKMLKGLFAYFFLTLSNPFTILYFAGVYSSLSVTNGEGLHLLTLLFAAGVFFGSLSVWLLLVAAVGVMKNNFKAKYLKNINKVSGAIIVLFGISVMLKN